MKHRTRLSTVIASLWMVASIGCAGQTGRQTLASTADATEGAHGGELVGRWRGTVLRSDGSEGSMIVEVAWTEPGLCAVVRYPKQGCMGYWTCTEETSDHRLRAIEHLDGRGAECHANTDVELKLTGGAVAFRARGEGSMSIAMLDRSERPTGDLALTSSDGGGAKQPATDEELALGCFPSVNPSDRLCKPARPIDTVYPALAPRKFRPIDRVYPIDAPTTP
ncbi:MAG: hypothetical protein U0271_40170 [Polyangiaceae bacterium]